jgi:hypothetical protein
MSALRSSMFRDLTSHYQAFLHLTLTKHTSQPIHSQKQNMAAEEFQSFHPWERLPSELQMMVLAHVLRS